ncbi:MAG: hypothetical protein DMD92_02915 [Candidatus Rokuibacteriota bacterium]|nr:MAG: hypothetical protein DMD92_02915 [Candidatus Rokubacteria bacterium]
MCGLCGVLGSEAHWTDAAGPDRPSGVPPVGSTRRQERLHRVRLANKVLKHYGLMLADWDGACFVLRSRTGRSAIVQHLAALWPVAERMSRRRCDPLDPALIAAVEHE